MEAHTILATSCSIRWEHFNGHTPWVRARKSANKCISVAAWVSGGVLEPVQAAPVIIEDHVFVGSRAIVVEGVHVESEAVLGANVVLTGSTKIIDVSGPEPLEYKGVVPTRSVVIPGSYTKTFAAGAYQVPCALIIGKRKESTDKKTSLNDVLREHHVAV